MLSVEELNDKLIELAYECEGQNAEPFADRTPYAQYHAAYEWYCYDDS